MSSWFNRLLTLLTLVVAIFAQQSFANEGTIGPISKRIDGTVLKWTSVEFADGYNIYGNSADETADFFGANLSYIDTVDSNEYNLSFSGNYVVIAFNEDKTQFSPWLIDGYPDFTISYTASIELESESAGAPVTGVSVNGNVISWFDDGWYQVQDLDNYSAVCSGGSMCQVPDGQYVVINHDTGMRYEPIIVPAAIVNQTALVDYLNDSEYQTENEYEIGIGQAGEVLMGKWIITFSNGQFDWSYSDLVEQGSYAYVDQNSMMATLSNTSFEVLIDPVEHKLEWMGKTYKRVE